jgi:hypothetical protein
MVTLNAAVSDPAANSYLTLVEADDAMEAFSQLDAWDDLDPDAQSQLLMEGTRLIDSYRIWGPKKVLTQRLEFPRSTDAEGIIPEKVKTALLEYLNYKLEGDLEPLKKLQAENVKSASVLGQSSSFEADESRLPAGSRKPLDELEHTHWPKGHENRTILGQSGSLFGDEC